MPANNSVKQNTATDLSIATFAKRSSLLISSSVIRLAVQLSILFLFSRNLSLADYGLYQSVWLYLNVLSMVALFGLPSLILSSSLLNIRQWIKQNSKLFICIALLVNFIPIFYVLFATTAYTFTTKLLIIVLSLIQNICILAETIAIKNKKEKLVLASNLIFAVGYFISHLIILYSNYSLQLILVTIIILFLIKTILLGLMSIKQESNKPAVAAALGKQWFYLGLYDVISVVFKWLDKWVILFFISITQFAIYFNGSYEIPIFGLMLSAVGNIMLVDLSASNNNAAVKIKTLFENSSLLLAAIVFPSFCFLFFYSHDFFTLLFSSKYADAIPVFLISIFVLPLRITNFTAALQVYHRNDLIVKGAVLDLCIAIVLMLVLYPLLQMRGLALAFVVSTYVQAAYYLWHTAKLINKKISYFFPFKKLFFLLLFSAVISGICYYLLSYFFYPINMIGGITVCTILILLLLIYQYKLRSSNQLIAA
jgi:O-antigen/teichoic acid export membrane protein